MKISKVSIILFEAALVFSAGAHAKESNKGTIRFADKVVVDGKSINPGSYTVEWTGSGSTVQVSLVQGKQTVATFPAHVTEQANPNSAAAYGSTAEPDGSNELTAIYPDGKRFALVLEEKEAREQSGTPAAK